MANFITPFGSFDPDVGLEKITSWSDPEESEFLKETNSILERYGFEPHNNIRQDVGDFISAEVGDDEQMLGTNPVFFAATVVMTARFGMVTSWEDTSIHPEMGNFAEDLVLKPKSYYQTYYNRHKLSGRHQEDLAFVDVPKLRLAIDVRPGRMNHSSTNNGKVSMVGSRNFWIPRKSPFKGIYEVFSLYQDLNLGLKRDKIFAYLPESLGGYGKPPSFSEPSNFSRFNSVFRQGIHESLNNEIVRRALRVLYPHDARGYQGKDKLLAHVTRFKSQYHDWIKGKSIYCPVTWIDCPPELAKFKVRDLENPAEEAGVKRLCSEGRVVTESQLSVMVEHNNLCQALLGSENMAEFKLRRESKIKAWKELSVYSLKSYGYIEEMNLESFGNKGWLEDRDISIFFNSLKEKGRYLREIFRREEYFWAEATKEVYKNGPMMVPFNCMPDTGLGYRRFMENRFDGVTTDTIGALDALETWYRHGKQGNMPTVLINDDEGIIRNIRTEELSVIVTDDKKLCKEANLVTRSPTILVPVEWYYRFTYFGEGGRPPWMLAIEEKFPHLKVVEHLDTGSIAAGEESLFKDGEMLRRQPYHKFNLEDFEPTQVVFEVSDDFGTGPTYWPPLLFDHRNTLRTKRR